MREKTTLSEAMLYKSGTLRKLGAVDKRSEEHTSELQSQR